ncbi:MAG: cytochrome c-type biogenesis protein CcmH [Candidatus Neomarinimicrobiota bacterium]|nr:cytochrome c-type biogenesis protein CcmH [Candidatus Neomarinimicrobiota bacterium]|tara:strand:- start:1849 stop:2274 length:426 start_codon:yes stop_codon:yes gene_type:complete
MKQKFIIIILLSLLKADEKSELIIDIEKSLMATCCWSGTVYDHGNKEMEIQIAGMVDQGKTKTEIINFYTDKYGERVLSIPVAQGFNVFAWLTPLFFGFLGLFIIYKYMRTSKAEMRPIINSTNSKVKYNDEIERELKELD